jgi:phage terminase large subunit GpA-like protein
MHPALEEIKEQLGKTWDPRKRPSPLDWAEKNVILDKRFSPRPGRYDCTYTPYLRKLHDWFGDPRVRQLTLAKSAKIGGTTWLANCLMWSICEDPGPILYVTSTGDNAKSWSERELHPRLKACEAIRPLLPVDADDFRKSEMHFTTCPLVITIVGTSQALAP